jgi:putative glutamine amidotransferase
MCDGIILQGGTDIYNYDLDAIKYIDKNNIPVLGICLGMQSLAVSKKGELDFIDNHKRGDITIAHNVNIDKFSKLYSIIKKEKIEVNSRHKEVVKNPGKYKVVGYDDENNIEALEDPNKDFCIGVQWHPEDLFFLNKETKYLFNAFIKSCFKYHNSKNIF